MGLPMISDGQLIVGEGENAVVVEDAPDDAHCHPHRSRLASEPSVEGPVDLGLVTSGA